MKTLYIDTHFNDIHIILFDDLKILKEKHVINEKQNSTFLVPSLKEVIDGQEFDEIIVCNGPGSFTGVRLGVTVAKTLAYTLEKPIKVLSYFDIMAYSLDDKKHLLGISDGNGYFIGEYENFQKTNEYYYVNNSEFNKLSNVETDVSINYEKVLLKSKELNPVNPHGVKPIYVKLIGVEYDKKN